MTQTAILEYAKPSVRQTLDFTVDQSRCNSCGLCAKDCPISLIQSNPTRMEQADLCFRCQHCMAICPTGAISIEGRKSEDSLPLAKDSFPPLEQVMRLVRGRRSVRQYLEKDVDPSLIQRLLETAAHAPTAVNGQELTFTVIDRRSALSRLREQVLAKLAKCQEEGSIPAHMGFLSNAPTAFYNHGDDLIFRGAPHLLLVSAPVSAPAGQTDIAIALATFELMATSAGLGAVWCGMLKMALEIAPDLKQLLDLPVEGIHYYPMLFGYPAVKYARTAQRDRAAVIKRLS